MHHIRDLFKGPGGAKELLGVAMPLVASYACDTVMMFTDRLFLSRLGSENMSAALAGGLSAFMFGTFFVGLLGYATSMVAQRFGAGRPAVCSLITTQSMLVALAAFPILLACIPLGHVYFQKVGIDAKQMALQRVYFDIIMMGQLASLLRSALGGFFSGVGRTRLIMMASVVSMVANVGINYVLIFGKLGMPPMGIRGAAIGTVIAGFLGLAVLLAAYFSRRIRQDFFIRQSFSFNARLMKELWRLGTPSGLELFLNLLAFTTLISLFHSRGPAVAAAISITFNWDAVSFVPLLGVNVGVTSLVGRYAGAGDLPTAHKATLSGLLLACSYTAILIVVFFSIPQILVDFFAPAQAGPGWQDTRDMAAFMVRLISLYLFADAVTIVFSGALRGVGDTLVTMILSVSVHWLLTGIAFLVLHVLHLSARTSWAVVVVAIFMLAFSYYARYRFGNWQTRAIALSKIEE
jgi:MATE family multidrug resistance protein